MIKYLRWNTANKRIKDLINNADFNKVRMSRVGMGNIFLASMPSGEDVEIWLSPSHIDFVWYSNGDERGPINPNRHPIARKFVYKLYNVIKSRKDNNDVEQAFYKVVNGAFHPFHAAPY